ncbi:MAG: zinc ribbon domain-containing protein, partial [Candidatus Thermoplasmatota archaeon]|nr:zinc ribbon domain-containing protein [Candidatus Thermoplasmatota archaeon]
MELYLIFIGLGLLSPILFLLYLQISSPSPPTTSSTTLRDKEGYVIKEIRPENISGKVKLIEGSKIWSATADEKIENGTRVRVSEVEGVHLKVDEIVGLEEGLEEFPPIEREIGEEMICPNCGSMLPPEAEECSVCGEVLKPSKEEELEEMEEPEEIPPIEREIEEEVICSTCGSVNPPEAE